MSTSPGMTLRSHRSNSNNNFGLTSNLASRFDPLSALSVSWPLQSLLLRLLSDGPHLLECRLVSRTWNHVVTSVGRVFLNRLHWSAGGGRVRCIRAGSATKVIDCKLVNGYVFVLAAINCRHGEMPRHLKVEAYALGKVKPCSTELDTPTLLWQCADVSPWAKGLFSDGRVLTVWAGQDTPTSYSPTTRTHRFIRFDTADVSLEGVVSADIADDDFSVALMEAHAARTRDAAARDEVRALTAKHHLRQAWSDNKGNLLVAYSTGRKQNKMNRHLLTAYDKNMTKIASRELKTKDCCMVRDYFHPLVLLVHSSAVPCIAVWNVCLPGNPASVWSPHHVFPRSLNESAWCRLLSLSMLYLVSDGDNVGEAGSWNACTVAQFARLPSPDAVNVAGQTHLPVVADGGNEAVTSSHAWLMQTNQTSAVTLPFTARPHVKMWGGLRRARVSGPPLIKRLYDLTDWHMVYVCHGKDDTVLVSDFSSLQD